MDPTRQTADAVTARLGLWDATSIIVGIIIGVGIFELPASIFAAVPSPWHAMGIWALGGLLALAGAFCFAELASTYPRSGGEYVYLTRTYGPLTGYLFAWAQLTVIRPGSIGALAYIFAMYANTILHLGDQGVLLLAVIAVVGLTIINILGVTLGTGAQHLLTIVKVLGLIGVIAVGCLWGSWERIASPHPQSVQSGWFATAMILILWTYSGWNEAAYVASEVKNSHRNLPLALLLGTAAVTVIYLLVNAAYILGLGMEGATGEKQIVAADLIAVAFPVGGRQAISLLIVISALGAINGMIFTTARLFAEFGVEHRVFRPLKHWSRRWGTPVRSLIAQGVASVAMIVGVMVVGQIRMLLSPDSTGFASVSFAQDARDGLDAMIAVTAAVFWGFFFLTGLSTILLRYRDVDIPRPFRVPLFPVLPLVFCGWCGYMVYGAIEYKPLESLIGVGLLVAGLPFYFMPQTRRPAAAWREPAPVPVGRGEEVHV